MLGAHCHYQRLARKASDDRPGQVARGEEWLWCYRDEESFVLRAQGTAPHFFGSSYETLRRPSAQGVWLGP